MFSFVRFIIFLQTPITNKFLEVMVVMLTTAVGCVLMKNKAEKLRKLGADVRLFRCCQMWWWCYATVVHACTAEHWSAMVCDDGWFDFGANART